MKAAFHTGKKEISVREVPCPVPGPGEYLLRIEACAICGSDTWWPGEATENEPVHGHEAAGVIAACGEGADKFKVGDRMIAYAILGCGSCHYCQQGVPTRCQKKKFVEGGFQEYSVYDERLLFPCPAGIDAVTASLLSDAVGVPLRGLRRLPPEKSDRVCVWGMGPLGLLQVMFLQASGVQSIIALDTIEQRLQKALELGADFAINPQKEDAVARVRELCGGIGADKAYTYVRNAKATESVFHSCREGASICTFVGLDGKYDLQEWVERNLIWSFYFTPDEFQGNLDFIARHKIDLKQVISDIIPLSQINEAFAKRFEQQDSSLKIVVSMYTR